MDKPLDVFVHALTTTRRITKSRLECAKMVKNSHRQYLHKQINRMDE